jgi:hypothetical protein
MNENSNFDIKGIRVEASDIDSPTDPNIPLSTAIAKVKELENAIFETIRN